MSDQPHLIAYIQAIIDAYNDCLYTRILKNINAVVFLGTPHRSSKLAPILANLLSVSFAPTRKYVTQLEVNSELIQLIIGQFRDRAERLEFISSHESTEIHGIGVLPAVISLLKEFSSSFHKIQQ
jgi:hypothetical protein